MVGKQRTRTISVTSTSTIQGSDKTSILTLYPWLKECDRLLLEKIHVSPGHILELLYHLENNVSAEVTRLKNKPNRATKFLTQFKKRLSSVKLASTMSMSSTSTGVSDRDFYPTYGLIMVHYVNLSLGSSKIRKFGPLHEAKQLLCILKLIFQEDYEYILDVLLASTLDEHTKGHLSVGFHLFSFIIEDWRQYSEYYERNTFLLKFCAVASTLFRTSRDGRQFVERNIPSEKIGNDFIIYLSKTLSMKFDQTKIRMIEVVKTIEVISVKSISRDRLVLVKNNDIRGKPKVNNTAIEKSNAFPDLALRNIPSTSQPALSSKERQRKMKHEIEDEFGLNGLLFELDTTGDNNFNYEANNAKNTANILSDNESKGCIVSSSSAADSHQRLHLHMGSDDSSSEVEEDDNQVTDDEQGHDDNGNPYFEERCHSEAEMDESGYYQPEYTETMDTGEIRRKNHKGTTSLLKPSSITSDTHQTTYGDKKEKGESTKSGKFVRFQSESSKFDSPNDSEDEIRPRKLAKQKTSPPPPDDSDIEILSEQLNEDSSESDIESAGSSLSRDEAEAESGEDVVPNYDESSDDEDDGTEEEAEENKTEATVPTPTTKTRQAVTLNSTLSSSPLKNQSNSQKDEGDVDTDTQVMETNKENNEEEGEASAKLKVPAQSEDILKGKNGSEMNLRQAIRKARSPTPQKSTPSPKVIDKTQKQKENNTIQRKDVDRDSSPPKRRRRGIQEESEVDDSSQDQQEESSQTPLPTIETRARRAVSRNIVATETGIGMSTRRTTRATAATRAKDATSVGTEVGNTSGRGRARGGANK